MPLFFDDRDWHAFTQVAQRLVNTHAAVEKKLTEQFNSPAMQRQIEQFNSPAMQRQIKAMQQYVSKTSTRMNPHVQRYIQQLQTDLIQEPDEHEVLEHPEKELALPETRERIVIYSPSLLLLEQLRQRRISLHDLTWRQFEEVLAEQLIQNGYTVELGCGTKDGGKDIIAMKQISGCGLVMSVWQAKKLARGNKVGIGVIRELADTRNELDASKGVIATTTSLTRGALARIEQDRYLLHKMDGNDLLTWIQQTHLPEGHSN